MSKGWSLAWLGLSGGIVSRVLRRADGRAPGAGRAPGSHAAPVVLDACFPPSRPTALRPGVLVSPGQLLRQPMEGTVQARCRGKGWEQRALPQERLPLKKREFKDTHI